MLNELRGHLRCGSARYLRGTRAQDPARRVRLVSTALPQAVFLQNKHETSLQHLDDGRLSLLRLTRIDRYLRAIHGQSN